MLYRTSAITAILCVAMAFMASNASAWDGERKGFQLGIGLGPGYYKEPGFNKVGVGTDFKIGYAPSNKLSIYWMSKATFFSLGSGILAAFSVGGPGVSYSPKSEGASPYIEIGAGFSTIKVISGSLGTFGVNGAGVAAGAGYNFANRFSIGGNLVFGKFSGFSNSYSIIGFVAVTGY